jgi:hypothetical protein
LMHVKITRCFRICARSRGVSADQKGTAGLPGVARIEEKGVAALAALTSEFVGLAAHLREKGGRKWRGGRGD